MSLEAVAWVLNDVRGLTPSQRLILIALADYADPETNACRPTLQALSDRVELAQNTVRVNLRALQDAELVSYDGKQDAVGRQIANEYRVLIPARAPVAGQGGPLTLDEGGPLRLTVGAPTAGPESRRTMGPPEKVPETRDSGADAGSDGRGGPIGGGGKEVVKTTPEMKDTPPTPPSASGLDAELLAELEMDGEPVVAALEEWLAYRRERKAKPYKTDRWLRAIAKWGPERAEAAIRHSMRMDWQGIFEPKAAPDPRFRRGRRGLSRSKDGGARYADVAMHESESV